MIVGLLPKDLRPQADPGKVSVTALYEAEDDDVDQVARIEDHVLRRSHCPAFGVADQTMHRGGKKWTGNPTGARKASERLSSSIDLQVCSGSP